MTKSLREIQHNSNYGGGNKTQVPLVNPNNLLYNIRS